MLPFWLVPARQPRPERPLRRIIPANCRFRGVPRTSVVENGHVHPHAPSIQPVYLLVDASGSTARTGFNDACNMALPYLIEALEDTPGAPVHLGILTFGATGASVLALTDVHALQFVPHISNHGFSSLASGLRLLGNVIYRDAEQIRADQGRTQPASVVIMTDGLLTDSADDLRIAYQDCCAEAAGLLGRVLLVLAGDGVAASAAGLGQGLAQPDVDVVELPVVDAEVLSAVVAGWLTRSAVTG